MISGVAVVPGAPVLLPENTSRVDVAGDLRADAVVAVRRAAEGADELVLVVATDREPRHTKPPVARRIAEHLVDLAGVRAPVCVVEVGWDLPTDACRDLGARRLARVSPRHTAVVVVADGSARRGEKAPGHLDERAFAHDAATVDALRRSDAGALLAIDAGLAAELLDAGRAPLQVLAGALDGTTLRCELLREEDPFGVHYVVATLTP